MTPNIVIIVLDAARAQNFSFYGYRRNTTPFLWKNRDEFAVYENAISSSYWTMPSVASLFTGMYTSGHGLVVDGDRLDERLPSLPSILKNHGYRCAEFTRNYYALAYSGLNRNFDQVYSTFKLDYLKKVVAGISKKSVRKAGKHSINNTVGPFHAIGNNHAGISTLAARITDIVFDSGGKQLVRDFANWLPADNHNPFFAYFHFLETHSPYRAPHKHAINFLTFKDNFKKLFLNYNHLAYLENQIRLSDDDFNILIGAYDNAIRYLDTLISKIVDLLKANRRYDDTMIIILSDHGDNIGDHGLMFHYWCLYDTLIRIPLVIKYPKTIGIKGKMSQVVQNVDILPTILGLIEKGDQRNCKCLQGNDILGVIAPRRPSGIAISELVKTFGPDRFNLRNRFERYDRRLVSVRTDKKKFIFSSRNDHESYDLKVDPNEQKNLYPNNDGFKDLMRYAEFYYQRMDDFYRRNRNKIEANKENGDIDSEVMESLISLGYM